MVGAVQRFFLLVMLKWITIQMFCTFFNGSYNTNTILRYANHYRGMFICVLKTVLNCFVITIILVEMNAVAWLAPVLVFPSNVSAARFG